MSGGTSTVTISLSGFNSLVFERLLNSCWPNIGLAGQDAVKLADPPAPAITGEDAVAVQMADDRLAPIGPERPSPFSASRKISRTVSACSGSISSVFLTLRLRVSAVAIR